MPAPATPSRARPQCRRRPRRPRRRGAEGARPRAARRAGTAIRPPPPASSERPWRRATGRRPVAARRAVPGCPLPAPRRARRRCPPPGGADEIGCGGGSSLKLSSRHAGRPGNCERPDDHPRAEGHSRHDPELHRVRRGDRAAREADRAQRADGGEIARDAGVGGRGDHHDRGGEGDEGERRDHGRDQPGSLVDRQPDPHPGLEGDALQTEARGAQLGQRHGEARTIGDVDRHRGHGRAAVDGGQRCARTRTGGRCAVATPVGMRARPARSKRRRRGRRAAPAGRARRDPARGGDARRRTALARRRSRHRVPRASARR